MILLLAYAIKTHSWTARQQQHHQQSGAGTDHRSAGFDDVGHRLGLTTEAQISVCKTPCLSTGTAMPVTGAKTVQERPLLSWKGDR